MIKSATKTLCARIVVAGILVLSSSCSDDPDGEAQPVNRDERVSPLALRPTADGREASLEGRLEIDENGCTYVIDEGPGGPRKWFLTWPADDARWEAGRIQFDSANLQQRVSLAGGETIKVSGGASSQLESGTSFAQWAKRGEWVSEPSSRCASEFRWGVGDLASVR